MDVNDETIHSDSYKINALGIKHRKKNRLKKQQNILWELHNDTFIIVLLTNNERATVIMKKTNYLQRPSHFSTNAYPVKIVNGKSSPSKQKIKLTIYLIVWAFKRNCYDMTYNNYVHAKWQWSNFMDYQRHTNQQCIACFAYFGSGKMDPIKTPLFNKGIYAVRNIRCWIS